MITYTVNEIQLLHYNKLPPAISTIVASIIQIISLISTIITALLANYIIVLGGVVKL